MSAIKFWTLTVSLSAVRYSCAQFSFPVNSLAGMYSQPNPGSFLPPGQPSPILSRHSMSFAPNVHFGTILQSSPSMQDDMLMRPGMQPGAGLHPLPPGSMQMPSGLSPAELAMQSQDQQPFARPNPASIFAARRAGLFGLAGGSPAYDPQGGRPVDTPDTMQPAYPMQFDNSGVPGVGGMPPFTLTGSPFRGDGMGVSYFPVGRFRPGAEVFMIGTKPDQEEGGLDPNVAVNGNDTVTKSDTSPLSNGTAKPSAASSNQPTASQVGGGVQKPVESVPTASTTVSPNKSQTSQPPCAHPVYMNRIFMSTALSMGLISSNTSCIILVDH
ncbi:uncharacterized protein LOC129583573 [Paramacrobiotus metropolitanus]|uniref:uncharacterized protein LOC129583573 n=1 Tax=Paramacrobiotus metropolitanus TaxID=2943436 RepID=UPI002445F10E|nr:uncharacterized protein LOC129583573 [Paramacrobiotus metropolitanus]XP_055331396.1 uncharacterized protein LOC129583573 [Paramacrobiotus metropolitanus]